jgi:hypothetical protein
VTHNPEDERTRFFRNVWKQLPKYTAPKTQKTCFLNMKTGLQLIKSISAVLFAVGKAAILPVY